MPLCNMRDLLKDARAGRYAVGSFSVTNLESVMGVIAAAEEERAPIIIQCAEPRLKITPLSLLGPLMVAAANQASVPVAVHLDHGATLPCIRQALDIGFTSVMLDGSALPLHENLALVEQVVALAKAAGASVEAEVGRVGRGEDGSDSPEQAASVADCFAMDALGIDALAVGIGNAHGLYAATPELRYDILEQLGGLNAHLPIPYGNIVFKMGGGSKEKLILFFLGPFGFQFGAGDLVIYQRKIEFMFHGSGPPNGSFLKVGGIFCAADGAIHGMISRRKYPCGRKFQKWPGLLFVYR